MPRRADQQIELFADLPEITLPDRPATNRRTIEPPVLPGLPAAPKTAVEGDWDDDDADIEDADDWYQRLVGAFAGVDPDEGFLPLSEEALLACPGHPDLLLMAVCAALLDGKHRRASVLLKRFSKRFASHCVPLLYALTLNLEGRRPAARQVLEKNRIDSLFDALRVYPAGRAQLDWLARQFGQIMERDRPLRQGGLAIKPRKPLARGPGAIGKSKRSAKRPAGKATRQAIDSAPLPVPSTPPPLPSLPLVDIDIPFRLEAELSTLLTAVARSPDVDGRTYQLRERLAHLGLVQGFDELLCLPQLVGVEPLWHQIETVRKVLKQFRGRVLLADEVGLGKTIEAGMVLKEYAMRGMAERVLVLTPASLVGQWREELECKFGLAFATTYDPLLRSDPAAFWDQARIIASIATARRQEHVAALAARRLDIVVVDEAHHLRDRASAGWRLVDALNKRFLLLLSATPVQNDLIELYNLLTLLKPGIFKTLKEFRAAYMVPGKPRQPANPESLRLLMRGAMIRNTRAVVALKLPRRHASTIRVEPTAEEADAYAAFGEAARDLVADGGGAGRQRLALQHLLTAAGSSPAAAAKAADRIADRLDENKRAGATVWRGLATRLRAIVSGAKETALIELLARNPNEKKLVFVQARETLEALATRLEATEIAFARFDGSMSGPDKDAAIAAFREHASVLLCTQSGGEGRNIQFCNTLINFDVPWNPMAIEQRIGRIDRIGQEREVFVFNLVTRGTIEDQVLSLLEEKISMFELVVGEVGVILGNLDEEREFPDLVLDAWLEVSDGRRKASFEALGAKLDEARRQHDGAKELDERLFGQDFETA